MDLLASVVSKTIFLRILVLPICAPAESQLHFRLAENPRQPRKQRVRGQFGRHGRLRRPGRPAGRGVHELEILVEAGAASVPQAVQPGLRLASRAARGGGFLSVAAVRSDPGGGRYEGLEQRHGHT